MKLTLTNLAAAQSANGQYLNYVLKGACKGRIIKIEVTDFTDNQPPLEFGQTVELFLIDGEMDLLNP